MVNSPDSPHMLGVGIDSLTVGDALSATFTASFSIGMRFQLVTITLALGHGCLGRKFSGEFTSGATEYSPLWQKVQQG